MGFYSKYTSKTLQSYSKYTFLMRIPDLKARFIHKYQLYRLNRSGSWQPIAIKKIFYALILSFSLIYELE